jgi:hypothetical protein
MEIRLPNVVHHINSCEIDAEIKVPSLNLNIQSSLMG